MQTRLQSQELTPERAAAAPPWTFYLSAAGGFDDNPTLTALTAGIYHDRSGDTWRVETGLRAANYWVDFSHHTTEGAFVLRGIRNLGGVNLDVHNDANFDRFSYESNQVMLGVETVF